MSRLEVHFATKSEWNPTYKEAQEIPLFICKYDLEQRDIIAKHLGMII